MKFEEKVNAKLKFVPEDFVVEEVGEKWDTHVSDKFVGDVKPDLSNLDLKNQKDFLVCEMEKFDIDHFSALKEVAFGIGKRFDDISYAGTKDKRAWTSQRISIFRPDLEKLREFCHPNILLKNFKWSKRKIKMGYLLGNHFEIVLRDVDKKDAILAGNKMRSLKWFPNYFGNQRFGQRGNNVKIGKLILKRKWRDVVWEILTGVGDEGQETTDARLRLRNEKDFGEAVDYFPRGLKLECQLLNYLSRNPEDCLGAIKSANRKSFLMYVNSVQSKIFNDVLELALGEGLDFTRKGQTTCLLMGYKSRFFDGRLGVIEREVLKSHGLGLSDFDVNEIGYLRIKGSFRKAVVEVDNLEIEIQDDDKFKLSKKLVLSFDLPSGVYATTFLENFFAFD